MILDKFTYLTLTVIDKDVQACQKMIDKILNDWLAKEYSTSIRAVDTDNIYIGEPEHNGPERLLIWEPKNLPNKTAFISNLIDGYSSLIYCLCERNSLSAISVKFTNVKYSKDDLPSFFLTYHDYSNNKNTERVVYAIKETHKWVYYAVGEVQPFEDTTNYENRIKPKRINKPVLLSYLKKLNIDIEDDQFWDSKDGKGVYFERLQRNKNL